jgi:hypothetical protein
MKRLVSVLMIGALFVSALSFLSAQESFSFDFTGSLSADTEAENSIYDEIRGAMDYRSPWFDLLIDWGVVNDGKYEAEEKYLGGRYFAMHDTRVSFHSPDGLFNLTTGRGPHRDAVDSPYSVFINSSDIPAMHVDFSYEGDFFFYTTRWVQLTSNSRFGYLGLPDGSPVPTGTVFTSDPYGEWGGYDGTWLDKGANFKTFGVRFGPWRVGFQDVVIYLDRVFDPEYFLNPMPQYFVQLINSAAGRPWSQADNAKSFMGFFTDYSGDGLYGEAQLLIDDINASFIPGYDQPASIKTKLAWSLGGWKDFGFGRLGFYHGGATKYTFEATYTAHHYENYYDNPGFIAVPYSIFPYEATYAPATEYEREDGSKAPIDYTENYFGYKYGENNLAFLLDYQNRFFRASPFEFGFYGSFEYVLNGAKSPANPWHEYYTGNDIEAKISLLDGTVEHLIRLSAAFRKPVSPTFILNLDIVGGVAINAIELIAVDGVQSDEIKIPTWEEPKIYIPQHGVVEPIAKVTVGGTWHLGIK